MRSRKSSSDSSMDASPSANSVAATAMEDDLFSVSSPFDSSSKSNMSDESPTTSSSLSPSTEASSLVIPFNLDESSPFFLKRSDFLKEPVVFTLGRPRSFFADLPLRKNHPSKVKRRPATGQYQLLNSHPDQPVLLELLATFTGRD